MKGGVMEQPITRDIVEVVAALATIEHVVGHLMQDVPHPDTSRVAEQELRFQADRLEKAVRPDTEDEGGHLSDLRYGYREAADALECLRKLRDVHRYVSILRRYQEGRLARMQTKEGPIEAALDERGRAVAFTEE